MKKINLESGLNITVYHNFYDEVEHFRKYIWKCNGICVNKSPYFGIVKRQINRAPGKNDNWWGKHQVECGGTFEKVFKENEVDKID